MFLGSIFFQRVALSKIKFQWIYELNNYLFQGILISKNLVVHTPVWIKNGITQCMGLVNKSLLADLMMMILNRKKTDGGCSNLICVQTSI